MSDTADLTRPSRPAWQNPGLLARSAQTQTSEDEEDELPSFGFLRSTSGRAMHLEFRRRGQGDSFSLPYSWLGPTRYHPSDGVVMVFSAGDLFLVRIRGRNLNRLTERGVSLYDRGILRHRVTWVREAAEGQSETDREDDCVVSRIEVVTATPEEVAIVLGGCRSSDR